MENNNINNNNQEIDVCKFIKEIKEGNIEYISSSISKDSKEYQYIKSSIDNTLKFYSIITNRVKNDFLDHIIFILSTSEDSNKYKDDIIKIGKYKDNILMSFIDRLDFYRNNNFFNIKYIIIENLKENNSEYKNYLFEIFSIIKNIKYDTLNSLDYIEIFEKLENLNNKIDDGNNCKIYSFINDFINKVFKTSYYETIINENIIETSLNKIFTDLLELSYCSSNSKYNEFDYKTNKYILSIISDIYGFKEYTFSLYSEDPVVPFYYMKILNNVINYLKEILDDVNCIKSFSKKTLSNITDLLHYTSFELNKIK